MNKNIVKPKRVMPSLSMAFDPASWNAPDVVNRVNCFAYALNDSSLGWPYLEQIRHLSELEGRDPNPSLYAQIIRRNFNRTKSEIESLKLQFGGLERIRQHQYEPDKRHIIAFSSAHRHFYRLDGDKTWSHKFASLPASPHDDEGCVIVNLEQLNLT
jgi:hypothetical protein